MNENRLSPKEIFSRLRGSLYYCFKSAGWSIESVGTDMMGLSPSLAHSLFSKDADLKSREHLTENTDTPLLLALLSLFDAEQDKLSVMIPITFFRIIELEPSDDERKSYYNVHRSKDIMRIRNSRFYKYDILDAQHDHWGDLGSIKMFHFCLQEPKINSATIAQQLQYVQKVAPGFIKKLILFVDAHENPSSIEKSEAYEAFSINQLNFTIDTDGLADAPLSDYEIQQGEYAAKKYIRFLIKNISQKLIQKGIPQKKKFNMLDALDAARTNGVLEKIRLSYKEDAVGTIEPPVDLFDRYPMEKEYRYDLELEYKGGAKSIN